MKAFSLKNPKSKFPLRYLASKTVLLRADFNVPLKKEEKSRLSKKNRRERSKKEKEENESSRVIIADNSKIKASLPTIRFLLESNCKAILMTHLGNPRGKVVKELSVEPVAKELKKLLPRTKISKLDDCIGKEVKEKVTKAKNKQIILLENLRFYKQEELNDMAFAHSLASLADVYVNDAFASCHRKHASVDAITHFLPSIAGMLVEKEVEMLSKALTPMKPAVWIMGGAKLNKIELLQQALKKADYVLIGGALAFSFLKARGIPTGMSKIDAQSVCAAEKILHDWKAKKIILPVDFITAENFAPFAKTRIAAYNQIKLHETCLDLGPETIKLFKRYIYKARTVVWNGPLGYFEWAKFATATKEIGRLLGNLTAISICGGGETAEAMRKFHLEHKITHLSTGGGAALEFLAGKELPGIAALERNYEGYKKRINKKK
ncbi:MAG: phosphoglycerate kinase [Nanoarchaeota archaeon]